MELRFHPALFLYEAYRDVLPVDLSKEIEDSKISVPEGFVAKTITMLTEGKGYEWKDYNKDYKIMLGAILYNIDSMVDRLHGAIASYFKRIGLRDAASRLAFLDETKVREIGISLFASELDPWYYLFEGYDKLSISYSCTVPELQVVMNKPITDYSDFELAELACDLIEDNTTVVPTWVGAKMLCNRYFLDNYYSFASREELIEELMYIRSLMLGKCKVSSFDAIKSMTQYLFGGVTSFWDNMAKETMRSYIALLQELRETDINVEQILWRARVHLDAIQERTMAKNYERLDPLTAIKVAIGIASKYMGKVDHS